MKTERSLDNVTAVVLAAGLGTRMKTNLPKVLHGLGSETLLGKIVSNLKKAGIDDIIAVVGYKAEIIEKLFNDRVRFVRQPELLGSGDAVGHAVDFLNDSEGSVLVTCGDTPLISPESYTRLINEHFTKKADCTLMTSHRDDPTSYGRILRAEDGAVVGIIEEKDADDQQAKIKEVNVGAYCFDQVSLKKYIRDIKMNKNKEEYYLTDIIEILVDEKKNIFSVSCGKDETIGINSRQDLAEAHRIINLKKNNELMDNGVTIMAPENTFIDEHSEVGKDTVVLPGCVIEKDVKIGKNCRIGPHAHIREGSVIGDDVIVGNFAELCRVEVGNGCRIKHHCYLGDAKLGEAVNIGAGVITANYDGKNKNLTEIGSYASIGVGTCLVAPVKIGRSAVTGAGSVVPKNKDVPEGITVAGSPAKAIKSKQGA